MINNTQKLLFFILFYASVSFAMEKESTSSTLTLKLQDGTIEVDKEFLQKHTDLQDLATNSIKKATETMDITI